MCNTCLKSQYCLSFRYNFAKLGRKVRQKIVNLFNFIQTKNLFYKNASINLAERRVTNERMLVSQYNTINVSDNKERLSVRRVDLYVNLLTIFMLAIQAYIALHSKVNGIIPIGFRLMSPDLWFQSRLVQLTAISCLCYP